MTEWRHPYVVEAAELARRLTERDLRVVDCRFSFEADLRGAYREGHIPGAAYCNWAEDLSDPPHPVRWMIASPERFAAAMARLGIGDETRVVAYDADGGHHAARLWWGLRHYGHDAVAILNGGLQAWLAAGGALEAGEITPAPARFTPRTRPGLRATKEDVLRLVGRRGGRVILDVRRRTEYEGSEVRAKRGGHIPGAVQLEWKEALDPTLRLRPKEELRALYAERGIATGTPVVTHCQAGVRAAHTAWVLALLGLEDVQVYDGSWEEWGNDPETPIALERATPRA